MPCRPPKHKKKKKNGKTWPHTCGIWLWKPPVIWDQRGHMMLSHFMRHFMTFIYLTAMSGVRHVMCGGVSQLGERTIYTPLKTKRTIPLDLFRQEKKMTYWDICWRILPTVASTDSQTQKACLSVSPQPAGRRQKAQLRVVYFNVPQPRCQYGSIAPVYLWPEKSINRTSQQFLFNSDDGVWVVKIN